MSADSKQHSTQVLDIREALGCAAQGDYSMIDLAHSALVSLEEQLETLQREHASCHESYDVVLRTWRDRALAAEASSPASELQVDEPLSTDWRSNDE